MKTKSNMNKKIHDILGSAESIGDVNVSPFFKEKVMQRIRNASEEVQDVTWSWFTPKLQLATLVCIVILNVMAFTNLKETNYDENVSSFATSYGLSSSAASSILD